MDSSADKFAFYDRPHETFLDLPSKYRWEFTRRHPYYLTCWQFAQAHRRKTYVGDPELEAIAFLGAQVLANIGVTGEPVDPATPFEDLDGGVEVDPGFLSGAVQPMTYRNIMMNVISAMPPEVLIALYAS